MIDRTSGASRFYKTAVATSALPLLAMGSAAAAAPAVADAPGTALSPKPATAANVSAAQSALQDTLLSSEQLAAQLPARFTQTNFQAAKTAPSTYKVKAGDTLGHVAYANGVSLSKLLKWNGLKASSTIYPGDVLKLGASASATTTASTSSNSSSNSYTVKTGDTLSGIAAKQGVGLSTLLSANGLSTSSVIYPGQSLKLSGSSASSTVSTASSTSGGSYKVKSGDTLSGIAASQKVGLSTLLKANGLSASSVIYPGQQLKLSGSTSSSASTDSSTASSTNSSSSYTVKDGDTLSGIAARNNVSLSTVLKANNLSLSSLIFPGQTIKLSGSSNSSSSSVSTASSSGSSSGGTYKVKSGDTLSGIAAKEGVSVSTLRSANSLSGDNIYAGQSLKLSGSSASSGESSGSTSASTSSASSYKVKSGDTLSGVASRNGLSLQQLLNANGMESTDIIRAGQTLKLGGSGSSSTSTASSGNDEQLVGDTFLDRTYPEDVVANANDNKRALLDSQMPSRSQIREMVRSTASSMGVDPSLALAHAQIESGFDATAVSPANAIGTMQVIPSSGEWASQLVGRDLNIMDPQDNITAGVAIIRHLQNSDPGDIGIAGYYQGAGGVAKYGMYDDTKDYVKKINEAKSRY
ncbi:MAG: LysM peptidoglycan-binding domain-containing protein [Yaniella sp.]|uniref:lytic transglycosylase domain-containing protein n=1 Tax=Yaniella sp. TaxID=2773929 RepID=UPI00264A01C1|nr:lytic transglycosylase domain-containing protein [Yaniella sp.]MDN5730891.1 LysM peptidoglycan-binding domain-containing protein [Yaniella sp.]MDN5814981.1 LysM peptidoglycan-binding domain-containing protein [Yaniella sp.]MDN5817577.1 LysM peptidoglycan-binding domain-containing protein [Yaniella sp.]MDN5888268.1 LysM peptidoglycan-binding domain-containing protein [Yaniella sp.]MDN5911091.1 LysM peptidoglycan-binding domain-containing protein [Yaniella sp.]